MFKKALILLIAGVLVLSLLTGCGKESSMNDGQTSQTQSATQGQSAPEELKEVTVSVFHPKDISQNFNDDLYVNYIKDKFNMTLKHEYVSSSAYAEKLNLLFATGEYPDVISFVDTLTINRLARDGFMLPVSDYEERLPNYKSSFTPEEWDAQVKRLSNARGKWFAIETKMSNAGSGTWMWIYRMKQFEKIGMTLPKTTEELYLAMKKFKEINPDATIPNRWGAWNALSGFDMAFRVQSDVWFDIDANDIVYGPATDKYRDLMKYMNRLYKEGLLAKEFATMTGEQRTAEITKGNVYVNFLYADAVESMNNMLKSGNQEADWGWSKDILLLTAYPDKEPLQQKYKPTYDFGTGLTDKLQGEALDRFLSYLDWSASEEGQIFHEMGIKGQTYDEVNGKLQLIGDAVDPADPGSYMGKLENFGPFGYYIVQNERHSAETWPLQSEVNDAAREYGFFDLAPIAFRYTPEEEKAVADFGTAVNDTRDEYLLKFIMGTKNPNNDSDWKEYTDKLGSAGLEKYLGAKKAAYYRLHQQ